MVASLRDKYLKIKQEGITPPRKKIADHDQSMDSAPVAAAGSNSFREELIAPFDEDVEMEDAFPPPLPSSPPPPLPSSPPPDR
ncbi:cyclin-dependent kinase 12 [Selaginella moellendorffii]|nr:cyclin-dependent kinase 12 [Selaginella moellendorffii]|eukprot:XP_002962516.2 cyclin-dependent kinase 12 [Selaginella moellendorffii]